MTDIRKCAQTVVDDYCIYKYVTPKSMNMLEQALAEPVEPVLYMNKDDFDNPFTCAFSVGRKKHPDYNRYYTVPLYTTPPSVDALIAEIDGLDGVSAPFATESDGLWIDADELKAILDKYRGQK